MGAPPESRLFRRGRLVRHGQCGSSSWRGHGDLSGLLVRRGGICPRLVKVLGGSSCFRGVVVTRVERIVEGPFSIDEGMRITGGDWRGRRIPELKGFQGRPTTDFGREGLFNLLSSRVDLSGLHILDLFSGTGMVSLECLSRGAASVTAVEKAPKACRFAMAQAAQLGSDDLHTVCADVWTFLNKPLTQFDLVFADPPYDMPRLTSLPEVVRESGVLASGGWFILEHGERVDVSNQEGHMLSRKYGHVHFSLFNFD